MGDFPEALFPLLQNGIRNLFLTGPWAAFVRWSPENGARVCRVTGRVSDPRPLSLVVGLRSSVPPCSLVLLSIGTSLVLPEAGKWEAAVEMGSMCSREVWFCSWGIG